MGTLAAWAQDQRSATTIIPELLHAVSDESNVFTDEDQTQALRIIGDLIHRHGMKSVPGELRSTVTAAALEMMRSDNLRVAGFAAVMLGRVGTSAEAPALLAFLDRVNNSDPVARHQASMGLTYIAQRTPGLLASLSAMQELRAASVLLSRCVDWKMLRSQRI